MSGAHLEEIPIGVGGTRAVISTVGAAPRVFTVDGDPLLDGFPEGTPPGSVNVLLSPWPNRVADGLFRFAGAEHRLEITEPERRTAIHGLAWRTRFRVLGRGPGEVRLGADVGPAPGWPWRLRHEVTQRVVPGALEARLEVRNDADEPAPLAVGVHLFPTVAGASADAATLSHHLDRMLPLDGGRLLPDGAEIPAAGLLGEGGSTALDGLELDNAFRDSRPAPAQREWELRVGARGVRIRADAEFRWAQLYTSPERRLAVEPMTAPPNALADGTDLMVLPPGSTRILSWRIEAV